MESDQTELTEYAADLRLTFDRTFASAPVDTSKDTEGFLAIGVGGDYYALRLLEISGLFADKKVTPLPSAAPGLLGIVSFRGTVTPIYDLRILLGYPTGPQPRWLVLVAPDAAVGLAVDHVDGYLNLSPEALAKDIGSRQHVVETLHVDKIVRSVVNTASIVEMIKRGGH